MVPDRNCPNCGAALPSLLAHARMVNCDFCGASVVLDDDVLRKAGEAGAMLDAPELVAVGVPVALGDVGTFTATGHVRYDYGRGHWDEYHGTLDDGSLVWVSVDEGDVVVQRALAEDQVPAMPGKPRIGRQITVDGVDYVCSEADSARAVAFRGQLPEEIVIGETHFFANFSGPRGALVSAELWGDGESAMYFGFWVDPFDVRAVM
ncbi:MAG: DUF4178 domain-containing protein [Jannaschia sp.]